MRTGLKVTAAVGGAIAAIVLAAASVYYYDYYVDRRFVAVTEGRVFRSAAMSPDLLTSRIKHYGIRSVIDLRTVDATPDEERAAVESAGGRYFHVPSGQIPTDDVVDRFLEIMRNEANYPVLIHCTHGEGRAPLFSAIYRIEIEGWEPEKARHEARWFADIGSFSSTGRKGRYLLEHLPKISAVRTEGSAGGLPSGDDSAADSPPSN